MTPHLSIAYYSFPTAISCGPGSRYELPLRLKDDKIRRPLIITDRGLVNMPWLKEIESSLNNEGFSATIFGNVFGNPTVAQVEKGLQTYQSHDADAIIAIGGGAPTDVAKAVALRVGHPAPIQNYAEGMPETHPIREEKVPPLYALPTTAGTGSEVGRSAVISDDDTNIKRIYFSPKFLPRAVFADAELTVGLPRPVTASTGMDALTHLIEALLVPTFHPLCDGIALEGIRLLAESFDIALKGGKPEDPEHLRARHYMLNAAMMGAIAFQKGLGVTHSCAHALSTVCDLHHGLANGILLPFCLEFNQDVSAEKYARIAHAAGLKRNSSEAVIEWATDLKKRADIPQYLTEVNVGGEHVDRLINIAFKDGCHLSNPKPVSEADFRHLFTKALGSV